MRNTEELAGVPESADRSPLPNFATDESPADALCWSLRSSLVLCGHDGVDRRENALERLYKGAQLDVASAQHVQAFKTFQKAVLYSMC